MLLRDHTEDQNKIQDSYKSKLFVIVSHHKDTNVYIIESLNKKGPKRTINSQLKKSQGDQITTDPCIKGPKYKPKLEKRIVKPQISHPYGTRSKTKAAPVSVQSVETDPQSEQKGHLGLGQWIRNLFGHCLTDK